MKNKLIKIITVIIVAICAFASPTIPAFAAEGEIPAFAAEGKTDSPCVTDICSEDCKVPDYIKKSHGCSADEPEIEVVVVNILNIIIGSLGIVAVIFVLIGGVGYMTSAGDAQKLKKARDTILYACIGLIICALAFAIVNFVIVNVINGGA